MDFAELRAFVTLAGTLHFAKASAILNLSPSALSRMVSRLEEETGNQLLERDTRQISLTAAGVSFLAFCQDSLKGWDSLHQDLSARAGLVRGTLRVFASVTACYSILPPFVAALGRHHPELKLSVETGDPAEAGLALSQARVDLALAALGPQAPGQKASFLVQSTPLVFVAGQDYATSRRMPPATRKQPLTPADLEGRPLIIPHRGLARERLDRWLRHHHIHPPVVAEVAGNEAILALTHLGLGLGLVPRLVLENSPFATGLVQYRAGPELGDYHIGFVLARTLPKAIEVAVRHLLEEAYPQGNWELPQP